MAADSGLTKLGELLREVGERLESGSGQKVLRAIFSTNNEIGRLARTRRELRDSLVELQTKLNLVTAQVKRDRFREARDAFAEVERTFGRVATSGSVPQKEFIERRGPETN